MSKHRVLVLAATGALLVGSVALAKGGILFPDWSHPTKGTYDASAGEMGRMPSSDMPWTTTTVNAAIDHKPLRARPVSVTGEIIDYSCYLQVGKHGDKHRDCGQKCVRNGQPVGLLAHDGTIYLLMDEEHDPRRDGQTNFREVAADHMAEIVTVHGTQSDVEGQKAIYVQGFMK